MATGGVSGFQSIEEELGTNFFAPSCERKRRFPLSDRASRTRHSVKLHRDIWRCRFRSENLLQEFAATGFPAQGEEHRFWPRPTFLRSLARGCTSSSGLPTSVSRHH